MDSCIDIKIWREGDALSFVPERVGKGISLRLSRQDSILMMGASRLGTPLECHAERREGPIEFRCGLVCTVGGTPYIEVSPDVVWLLPDKSFNAEFVVYSNVTWKIE